MRRRRSAALAATVAAWVLLAAAPVCADAGQRLAPKRFVGVMWDREIQDAPRSVQRAQWASMASSGVETARVLFSWEVAQEERGHPTNFKPTDTMAAEAARHGIDLLPVVMYAPAWTRVVAHPASAPRDNAAYARFIRTLVRRYGPDGGFWRKHPELPKRPIRTWQIWNEPHLTWQFKPHARWAERYGALLRTGYRAVKRADPGARVVLAGLVNDAWNSVDKLYRAGGIRGYFDVAAAHVYDAHPDAFTEVVRRFREALDRNGDAGRPIFLTEAGASASKGDLEAEAQSYFQVSHRQMAQLVPAVFKRLARRADDYGIERVYWYTWASGYGSDMTVFGFSGLNSYAPGGPVLPVPGLEGYRKMARALQGCVKDTKARCTP